MKQSKLKNSVINSNQVKCSTKLNDTISSNRSHKTIKSNKSLNSVKKSKDTIIKVVANKIKDIDENKENKEINSNKNSSKIKVSNNTLKPQNFNSTINSKNNNSILHITNTSVISGISETVFNNNNIIKWPKIFHCIIKGTIKDTLKAIKQGENVNSQLEYGETPLLQAVELDKLDQAKLLLKFKADVNLSNNDGLTPLHVAVYRKNSQMVKLLLDFKADTNIQNRYFLQTSLHTCCISNSTAEIFYLLIHFGGNPTIKDYQNKKPFEYVTKDSELNKAIEKLKTSSFTQLNIQSLKEKNDISQDGMHSKRSKFEIENFSTSKMINIMNNTVNSSFEGNESAIQYFNTCQTNQSNSNIIVFNQLNYDNNNISEINYLNDMNCAEVTNKEFLKDEHFNVSNNNIIANSFVDKTYMPNLPMNSFFQFSRISGSNINSQNHTRNNSEVIKVEENSKQSSEESKKKDKSNEIEQNKLYNVNGNNSTFNLMFNNCSINYSNLSNSNNEILDQNKSIQQKSILTNSSKMNKLLKVKDSNILTYSLSSKKSLKQSTNSKLKNYTNGEEDILDESLLCSLSDKAEKTIKAINVASIKTQNDSIGYICKKRSKSDIPEQCLSKHNKNGSNVTMIKNLRTANSKLKYHRDKKSVSQFNNQIQDDIASILCNNNNNNGAIDQINTIILNKDPHPFYKRHSSCNDEYLNKLPNNTIEIPHKSSNESESHHGRSASFSQINTTSYFAQKKSSNMNSNLSYSDASNDLNLSNPVFCSFGKPSVEKFSKRKESFGKMPANLKKVMPKKGGHDDDYYLLNDAKHKNLNLNNISIAKNSNHLSTRNTSINRYSSGDETKKIFDLGIIKEETDKNKMRITSKMKFHRHISELENPKLEELDPLQPFLKHQVNANANAQPIVAKTYYLNLNNLEPTAEGNSQRFSDVDPKSPKLIQKEKNVSSTKSKLTFKNNIINMRFDKTPSIKSPRIKVNYEASIKSPRIKVNYEDGINYCILNTEEVEFAEAEEINDSDYQAMNNINFSPANFYYGNNSEFGASNLNLSAIPLRKSIDQEHKSLIDMDLNEIEKNQSYLYKKNKSFKTNQDDINMLNMIDTPGGQSLKINYAEMNKFNHFQNSINSNFKRKMYSETNRKTIELANWLTEINLQQYFNILVKNDLYDLDQLKELVEENIFCYEDIKQMKEITGIEIDGHAFRFLTRLKIDCGLVKDLKIVEYILTINNNNMNVSKFKNSLLYSKFSHGNGCCFADLFIDSNPHRRTRSIINKEKKKFYSNIESWLKKDRQQYLEGNFSENGFDYLEYFIIMLFTDIKIDHDFLKKYLHIYHIDYSNKLLSFFKKEIEYLAKEANGVPIDENNKLVIDSNQVAEGCNACMIF